MSYLNIKCCFAALTASLDSAGLSLRPVLMTSFAMVAGMIPMALGTGEAGEQVAPLGHAVIGGLIASTLAALYIVPQVYVWLQGSVNFQDPSLLPDNQDSSQSIVHSNGSTQSRSITSI
ncbi:efflux RND transporter permease subunit [Dyadobacter sp. CY345]|uniref:efflux RND transporter permease subunit n=1 Tax=Dyadobacter sp. CY345 TaxID=2909335 RepID=UPI001F47C907|nr:efflux RND transporter permease subunit [Dyadobacter sp. CY345]MCF2447303.1 efflux RND transporter permease subunit [Dyadobacter sp. CY345]